MLTIKQVHQKDKVVVQSFPNRTKVRNTRILVDKIEGNIKVIQLRIVLFLLMGMFLYLFALLCTLVITKY